MFHCPFQGTSLVDDVGEVGFRSVSYILVSLSHVL